MQTLSPSESGSAVAKRLLGLVAAACLIAVIAGCFGWVVANPQPVYFDEALYANSVINDLAATRAHGIAGFLDAYWRVDPLRPPAERLLVFPIVLAFGPQLFLLRAVSIIGFLLAALWLGATVRVAAGDAAAALTMALVVAAPVLVHAVKMYGTEFPLVLALVGTAWYLTARPRQWPLLGLCIGIGLLSKVSYLVSGGPMLFAALLGKSRWPDIARPRAIVSASFLGAAIAGTWWIRDGLVAWNYGRFAATSAQHSLGSWRSVQTFVRFTNEAARCGLGYGIAALAIVVALMVLFRRLPPLSPASESLCVLLLAGSVLPPLLSYFGRNHNPRYVVPSVFLVVGILAITMAANAHLRWTVAAIAVVQVVLMVFPRTWPDHEYSVIWRGVTEVMAPAEQWDWGRLRELADTVGERSPIIAIRGAGYALNPQQIIYAWGEAGRPVAVMVLEEGPAIAIQRAARFADIVVTAPGYTGDPSDRQPEANAGNDALMSALQSDPRFTPPVRLDVGLFSPAPVSVSFRKKVAPAGDATSERQKLTHG